MCHVPFLIFCNLQLADAQNSCIESRTLILEGTVNRKITSLHKLKIAISAPSANNNMLRMH